MKIKKFWRMAGALALVILAAISALLLAATPRQHPVLIRLTTILLVLGTGWTVFEFYQWRKNKHRYVARMSALLNNTAHSLAERINMPVMILDSQQKVVWYNNAFEDEITVASDIFGLPLRDALPILDKQLGNKNSVDFSFGNKTYNVLRDRYDYEGGVTYMLTFRDITKYVDLVKKFKNSRLCVVMIVIDNLEDTVSGTTQSERTSIISSVEQKIFNLSTQMNGICIHHPSDEKFILLVEAQHYLKLEHEQFPILDEVRRIVVSDKNEVTLSIGVGRSGDTALQNEKFAAESLDMAQSRGGDQAVIKITTGYKYCGGKSKGVERKSKVRYRRFANQLAKLISESGNVYIMGHRLSDLDAVGAAIGTAFITESLGKRPHIVLNARTSPARPLITRMMHEHPEYLMNPDDALEEIKSDDLLIIVDTYSVNILDVPALYEAANRVIVIDHHRKMSSFIDNPTLLLHEPYASSASELITEIVQYLDCRSKMPRFTAEALLSGIMLDTKNFIMQTGAHTFESAAYLRERGADPVAVKTLFAATMDSYRHRSLLVSQAEIYQRYAIAVSGTSPADIQIIASQTADDLLGIEGVDASFVLFPRENLGCISARSLGKINVQTIMEKLGGGGHQTMAATQIKDCSMRELRSRLIDVLEELEEQPQKSPADNI